METGLFNRLQATLLAVVTVGLVLLAVWNFRQESQFQQPDDGVWWAESHDGRGLIADKVLPNSPGQRAGIHVNDLLTGVNDTPTIRVPEKERELFRTGVYGKANYAITRGGVPLDTPVVVIPEPPDRSLQQALRFIGLIYSGHRPLCPVPPLDRTSRDTLLPVLPGLVRVACHQGHRQA